jgi:hypothetical protein
MITVQECMTRPLRWTAAQPGHGPYIVVLCADHNDTSTLLPNDADDESGCCVRFWGYVTAPDVGGP